MAAELCLYRADAEQLKPVRVLCPDGRYPHRDADGHQVFVNSHFDTEQEAWQHLIDNAQAGVSLAGGRVKQARQCVLDANEYAAEMAVEFQTVRDHYRDWERDRENAAQSPQDIVGEECDE